MGRDPRHGCTYVFAPPITAAARLLVAVGMTRAASCPLPTAQGLRSQDFEVTLDRVRGEALRRLNKLPEASPGGGTDGAHAAGGSLAHTETGRELGGRGGSVPGPSRDALPASPPRKRGDEGGAPVRGGGRRGGKRIPGAGLSGAASTADASFLRSPPPVSPQEVYRGRLLALPLPFLELLCDLAPHDDHRQELCELGILETLLDRLAFGGPADKVCARLRCAVPVCATPADPARQGSVAVARLLAIVGRLHIDGWGSAVDLALRAGAASTLVAMGTHARRVAAEEAEAREVEGRDERARRALPPSVQTAAEHVPATASSEDANPLLPVLNGRNAAQAAREETSRHEQARRAAEMQTVAAQALEAFAGEPGLSAPLCGRDRQCLRPR